MASTRTPGITTSIDGRRFIDKRYRGLRIGMRVGAITQEKAELRLHTEIQRIDLDLARRAHPHPLFRDCAARYLAQSRDKNSIETIRIHVGLLMRHLGSLEPQQIHHATLAPFIAARLAAGASATTINRSLEVVRTILNRSARSYRDDDGLPWLNAVLRRNVVRGRGEYPERRARLQFASCSLPGISYVPPGPLRRNTRDAVRPAPIRRARVHPPAIDAGILDSGVAEARAVIAGVKLTHL